MVDFCTTFAVMVACVITMIALIAVAATLADMACERVTGHGLFPGDDR